MRVGKENSGVEEVGARLIQGAGSVTRKPEGATASACLGLFPWDWIFPPWT